MNTIKKARHYIAVFSMLAIITACTDTPEAKSHNKKLDLDRTSNSRSYPTQAIIIAFNKDTSASDIVEFDQSLPQHVKKALSSKIIFTYRFSTENNRNKAMSLIKSAAIINTYSQDRVFKLDPNY